MNYLLGRLDRSHLGRLRDFGGLQAYPSRTKDPDPIDFSTGSVGLGAAAPLFAGVVDRYVRAALRHPRRPALRGGDRRRRARRGQRLGGGRRPVLPRARQRHVDRRLQPPVARPRHPGRPLGRVHERLPRARLARRDPQVRPEAARGVRRCRAATRCAGGSTTCRTPSTRACCASRRGQLRAHGGRRRPARRPRRARARARALLRRGAARPDRRTSPGTTSATSSTRSAACDAERQRPSVIFAFTVKGCGPADRGPPAEPLGGATRRADRRAARCALADPRRRVGRRSTRRRPAGAVCAAAATRLTEPETGRASTLSRRRGPGRVRPDAAARDVVAGGVRAGARRPRPLRGRRAAHRHDLARRLDLDRPRRLDQQARRVRADGRGGVRVRGGARRCAGRPAPRRPAHRARHLAR